MEADNYPKEQKDLAYQVCDQIRVKNLDSKEALTYFKSEMKNKFPALSDQSLDHLFSYGMFCTR